MRKKSDKERRRRIISAVYFGGLLLLLLWNLLHCEESVWEYREAYLQGTDPASAETVELRDEAPIHLYCEQETSGAVSGKAKICGIFLLHYENSGGLIYVEESVRADFYAGDPGEKIGTAEMLLRNQTPYPEDETRMYLALPERIEAPAEEPLSVVISSGGLRRNGITFSAESVSTPDGERFPVARVCYARTALRPFGAILRFLIGAALGLLFLAAYHKGILPAGFTGMAGEPEEAGTDPGTEQGREKEKTGAETGTGAGAGTAFPPVSADSRKAPGGPGLLRARARRQALALLLVISGLLILYYTYRTAVRGTAEADSADYLISGTLRKDSLSLSRGDRVIQRVYVKQDRLTGVGIRIRGGEEDGEQSEQDLLQDAVLSWRILDDTGTSLGEGRAAAEDLQPVSRVLSENTASGEVRDAAAKYLLLPLDQAVSGTKDRWLQVELSVEKGTVPLQVSEGGNGELVLNGQSRGTELCLLGVYRNNRFLKTAFWMLSILLILSTSAAFLGAGAFRLRLSGLYLVCALTMGFLFSFVTPAYTIADERTHIETAYALSNRFLGIRAEAGPERLMKRTCDVDTSIRNTMPISVDRYRETLELGGAAWNTPDEKGWTPVYARNALGNASAFTYLPAAAGMTAARLAGRNMITMIMAGRWMNLIVCALLISFAVRIMPVGAPCMAVIALFPRTIQLMASCSYDGMILAGSFLFTACCFHMVCRERIRPADLAILAAAGAHTALCKGGAYLPVIGILFLIPLMKRGLSGKEKGKWYRLAWALCMGLAVLFVVENAGPVLTMLLRKPGTVTLNVNARTLFSVGDLLRSPGLLLKLISNTLQIRTAVLIEEMVCLTAAKPGWLVYSFLFLAFLGACRRSGEQSRFTVPGRVWTLCLILASAGLIAFSMLLAYTPVDSNYIQGIQGRYFLPLLPLVFLSLESSHFCREKGRDISLLLAADLLLALSVCQILIGCFGGL